MGIKKNPYRAVFQDPFFVFRAAHLERVPVTAIADQVEGGDEDQDDIAQKAEIHRPRLQQLHIDVALVVAAALGQVAGIAFLYFRIVDAVIQIPGPDVQPNMAVPG